MNRLLLTTLLMLPLFLLACAGPNTTGPGGGDPKELPAIRMYNSSLGVGDYLVEVSPSGMMMVQERLGNRETDVRRSSMQLSPEAIQSIQTAFKGWKKLQANYPGEWSALVQIKYDGYEVSVHDPREAPKTFTDGMATLIKYAQQTVAQAASRPATSPAN